METPPTTCPICKSPIKEKSGVSQKTGKPYRFYGCSSYPKCDYIWRPEPEPAKEIPRVIPSMELSKEDKETLLKPYRELWVEVEEIKKGIQGILANTKQIINFFINKK